MIAVINYYYYYYYFIIIMVIIIVVIIITMVIIMVIVIIMVMVMVMVIRPSAALLGISARSAGAFWVVMVLENYAMVVADGSMIITTC